MLSRLSQMLLLLTILASNLSDAEATGGLGRMMTVRPGGNRNADNRRPLQRQIKPRNMRGSTQITPMRMTQQPAAPTPVRMVPPATAAPVQVARPAVPNTPVRLPVAATAPASRPAAPPTFEAPAGATLTLSQTGLGEQPGQVHLRLDAMTVRCEVLGWEAAKVTFRLPEVLVKQPLPGSLEVILASGKPAATYAIKLVAEPRIVVHHMDGSTPSSQSPLAIDKYAAQNSELGLPVPAPSLPPLANSSAAGN